uniref:Phosphatidylinositol transfer protein, alpha a n=1 Tax=Salarias fasciatus TaxID=181472 RepID=A0A672IUI4_SALFA
MHIPTVEPVRHTHTQTHIHTASQPHMRKHKTLICRDKNTQQAHIYKSTGITTHIKKYTHMDTLFLMLTHQTHGWFFLFSLRGSSSLHGRSCSCAPVLTNTFMKDKFKIVVETWHKPDMGEQDNVHKLDDTLLKQRDVVEIDITENPDKEYKEEEDPAKFKSKKTGRGPLGPDWKKELAANPNCPHMCAYKLVTVEFKWLGFQGKTEDFIHKFEKRVFTKFHRQLFCWLDKWYGMDMEDIRKLEEDTKAELDQMIKTEDVRGTVAE